VAEPVLLISSDPFLGPSLDAVARGRVRVARLDPSRRPPAWPGEAGATVVLDVTARQRDAAYAWVRRHHPGPLVVLLKPGERDPILPPDPGCLVIRRPFRLSDLLAVLEQAPAPAGADEAAAAEEAGSDEAAAAEAEGPEKPRPAEGAGGGPSVAEVAGAGAGPGPRDLLTASAEQRRRRLGSLTTPPPISPAPPTAAPAHATATRAAPTQPVPGPTRRPGVTRADWPTAATRLEVPRPPMPRRRGRRVAARVLVGVAVLLALAAGWLAFGLLEAREDLAVIAGAVRDDLTRAEAALERGDPTAARAAVRAAGRNLDVAAATIERRELRVAARLPVLSGAVADARHLLAAGRNLVRAGERAAAVAARLRPGRSAALRGGRFDLRALDAAAGQGRRLLVDLERARAELQLVRGGPLAPGAAESRRWALDRLAGVSARVRAMVPTVAALPAALGAEGSRTYLVVLTDRPAPGPAGGGPLAALEVVLDDGVVGIRPAGDELAERLEDAGAAADLPGAARALLGPGQARPDGVVAVDPPGTRALLEATGPVDVPGLGRLDGDDAPELGVEDGADRPVRELLLGALLGRVLAAPDLVATGQALRAAGADGHLRVYAADPGLRRVLARHRLDGATAPARR
jgi:hypothetical protein